MKIQIPIDWSDLEAILVSIQFRLDKMQTQIEQSRLEALDRLDGIQKTIENMELRMSKELDDLEAAVAADTAVDQSAITLLEGLKAQLDAAGTDRVKLKALSDSLGANQARLAAAVTANTPAAEPPVEPPVEPPPA